jgi:hypothetical protein
VSFFGRIEHLRYRRLIDASIDDELNGELARRVRAHVSACRGCAHDEDVTITLKRRLRLYGLLRPPVGPHRPDGPWPVVAADTSARRR